MCCFNAALHIFVFRHSVVVVHLQAPYAVLPDLLILLLIAAAPAAFAPAAAVSAAEAQGRGHQFVPRCKGVQRPGQEVPGAENLWQIAGPARLHHIDNDYKDDQSHDGHADADHDFPSGQGQAEHRQRKYQEAQEEVKGSKPAVFGCPVP